jgi:hypothetical protein
MYLSKYDALEAIRNAAEPYTIIIRQPYVLTQEELEDQIEDALPFEKDLGTRTLTFQSFSSGILKMLNTNRKSSYVMTLGIEADKLHISCNCASQVKTLCIHSYNALANAMVLFRYFSFAHYRPNGIFDLAAIHPDYFDKVDFYRGVMFKPKDSLCSVYQITEWPEGLGFDKLITLPSLNLSKNPPPPQSMAVAYIIMAASRQKYLPFLSSCLANLSKSTSEVKSFQHFLSASKKEVQEYLSDEQNALNVLCHGLWQQTAKQSGSIIKRQLGEMSSLVETFNLWQLAWPMLIKQEFVYAFAFYNPQALKEKPTKHNAWRINPMAEKTFLRFLMKEKATFYELHLKIIVNDIPLKKFKIVSDFLIKADKDMYLLSCLRDAGIVEWMQTERGHVTIFKEHFRQFEQECLNPLREHYPVISYPLKGKPQAL